MPERSLGSSRERGRRARADSSGLRCLRVLLSALLGFGGVVTIGGTAAVAQDGTDEQLAARFAPVVRTVEQPEPCGPGEPFQPSDVDPFLGNPDVALRGPWDPDNLIKIGPTGEDLADATAQDYLDLPGNPLKPGCGYEKWAREVTAGSPPTVYAHVVVEAGQHSGVALQYWFYYPFNDYNNKHESDWEMIQLVFAAADAGEAMGQTPVQVGYSQHEGVEVSDWDDPKLDIVDQTHPVVYPAAGSHAGFYDSALYLGRSGQEGFGCDNTLGPSVEARPVVRLIPSDPARARAEYPWIAFPGRWGQQEKAFFNAPTGPATKESKWSTPVAWQEANARSNSYAVPTAGLFGTHTTDFFCNAVASGSNVVRVLADNPAAVVLVLASVALVVGWLLTRTTWRPTAPLRLARRRAWGQIIAAGARLYRERPLLWVGIGAPIILVALATAGLQAVIIGAPDAAGVAPGGEAGGFRVTVAALLTYLLMGAAVVLVQAATVRAVVAVDAGAPVGTTTAYRRALQQSRAVLGAFVAGSALVTALGLSVVLLPLAVVLAVLFTLFVPVATLEGLPTVRTLRRSAALVRHQFWKITSLLVVSIAVAAAAGPLLGTLLLLTTSAPFAVVNIVSGITFALLMPFIALTLTYAYCDAALRAHRAQTTNALPEVLPADAELRELAARPTDAT